MAASKELILNAAKEFLAFINKSPSPFHAVDECRKRLVAAGFKELRESEHWTIQPKDKCFVTKNQSTLIAFAVGGQFRAGNGLSIIGAHTDSPCLKVKPISRGVKEGYIQVGVECYGGGIWQSWFDRDLKVAGKVIIKTNTGTIDHVLVDIDRPILRVPNIAIHLHREMNEKFEFNKESHLCPVLATVAQEQLETGNKASSDLPDNPQQFDKHHPVLIQLLCLELNIVKEQILGFELCLADATPSTIGGAFNEFIFSARLDNLHSSYCALQGLLGSCKSGSLDAEQNIRMISLFDNEEVGSESAQGAASMLQESVIRRLCSSNLNQMAFEEAIPKSFMISADMAHAVHPNYSDKHEKQHRPDLHKGIVVKCNANQRYATTSFSASVLREIARIGCVPIQDFVVRNDAVCGSTIGPIMSTRLGMTTVDVGAPQLSMHSIREMCATTSILQSIQLFQTFFEHYSQVYSTMNL